MNRFLSAVRPAASIARSALRMGGCRRLNVHEYVSMDVMKSCGITTPKCGVAHSVEEAERVYNEVIGTGKDAVIKAMVLTGGRGLGRFTSGLQGGVHLCTKPGDVKKYAEGMLGNYLVTKQTTAEGMQCNKVLLVERMYMRREMYISIMLDRAAGGPLIIASPAGGTSIEDVAEHTPELIFKQPVDITKGIQDEETTFVATSLGFIPGTPGHRDCKDMVEKMYKMFTTYDCTLVEVNPLAETPDGRVVVCDGKINFDDNAEFRQKKIFNFRDKTQEDPREVEVSTRRTPQRLVLPTNYIFIYDSQAAQYDLNYIGLSGDIGCMVNGAGLAMATMDIIKLKGGNPANFLDVGGGANENQVQKAFELLNADRSVHCILVNIFGGIMRCDVIATGIINAAKNIGMEKPIIVRLKGTNVEEARKLIQNSGLKLFVNDDLEEAADKAVNIAKVMSAAKASNLKVTIQ